MRKSITYISCLVASLGCGALQATPQSAISPPDHSYENHLVSALEALEAYRPNEAIQHLEQVLEQTPDFALAQLVYADLLMARAGAVDNIAISGNNELLSDLRDEARARLGFHQNQGYQQRLPRHLLRLAPRYKHVVLVDLKQSRLFLYENTQKGPKLQYDGYVSMGKNGAEKWREGDKRTPVGVYFVTDFLSPSKLPDYYGAGAFPINYPNAWDRRLGRTGYGIWLHGNPVDSFSRPPLASDGCVTINNEDFEFLKAYIDVDNTPMIIANGLEWSDAGEISQMEQELEQQLHAWQQNWQSMNDEAYLQHYSQDFVSALNHDLEAWSRNKSWSNQQKSFIEIEVDEVSMFLYPGEKDMALVDFKQHYRSDSYKDVSMKRQYWKREKDGRWRIIYEGPAS